MGEWFPEWDGIKEDALLYIPTKKEWGIEPSDNSDWNSFEVIDKELKTSIEDRRAPLVWIKQGKVYCCLVVTTKAKVRAMQHFMAVFDATH